MKFEKKDLDLDLDLGLARKFGRAVKKYKMLEQNETIAVGMSGGKDSYTLLDLFYRRQGYLPIKYKLVAVHVDFGFSESQTQNIRDFCKPRDIECFIEKQDLKIEEGREINCFYCSWIRRTHLFKFVGRLGIKKLALGHHLNDLVETIFLNMFYQSKFESFLPNTQFFKGEFNLIRPLILCRNNEIVGYANRNKLPYEGHKCPFGLVTQRTKIREILDEFEKKDERIIYNISNSWLKKIDSK